MKLREICVLFLFNFFSNRTQVHWILDHFVVFWDSHSICIDWLQERPRIFIVFKIVQNSGCFLEPLTAELVHPLIGSDSVFLTSHFAIVARFHMRGLLSRYFNLMGFRFRLVGMAVRLLIAEHIGLLPHCLDNVFRQTFLWLQNQGVSCRKNMGQIMHLLA